MGRTRAAKAGLFRFTTVRCTRSVGVRIWWDASGAIHGACATHYAGLVSRFPEADPPMPTFLHEEQAVLDEVDAYKREQDRRESWTAAR